METPNQSSGRCATRPTSIGTAGRLGSETVADIISECPADIIGIRRQDIEGLLDDLAEALRQAGREHHEMLGAELAAPPVAGNA